MSIEGGDSIIAYVTGLFNNSNAAGEAVAELKDKGFGQSVSVVAQDEDSGKLTEHNVEQKVADGATEGAVAGGVIGGIAGLLVGAASFVVPGLGLLVLGPLATTLTGAVTGGATGGIVGALVDEGIPEDKAREYEDAIKRGQVLISAAVGAENEDAVATSLLAHGASEVLVEGKVFIE